MRVPEPSGWISQRIRAAHTAVPACAHYDLAHSAVDHTVSALLLLWDGKALVADDADDLARALRFPGARIRPDRPAEQVAGST